MSLNKSLIYRCLSLTGSFETSRMAPQCFAGLTGNFDGQGISFGVLQWNFGQGTLQKLLKKVIARHPAVVEGIFKNKFSTLKKVVTLKPEEAIRWAKSIQTNKRVNDPWKSMFKKLGLTSECQEIQTEGAKKKFDWALRRCEEYSLWTERAAALLFDIRVQNGSIKSAVKTQIVNDFSDLPLVLSQKELEIEKMKIIANRRAEASNPRYVEDVRKRKLCCATGKGTVHGKTYNLREQFGITMKAFESDLA